MHQRTAMPLQGRRLQAAGLRQLYFPLLDQRDGQSLIKHEHASKQHHVAVTATKSLCA
jgi:hypothetical protein